MTHSKHTDLHGRGEPPFPRWDPPRPDEPAHGYFVRLSGINRQQSATASARSFGLNGVHLQPSECLDFALAFPIGGKERLSFVTPKLDEANVIMAGQTFRCRNWSMDKRYFCPGCLAEDAYHRFFWDIVVFRHCPIHDLPLRCVDSAERQVPWWSPSFTHSPFGNPITECRKRVSSARPSIESYLLGRFALCERLSVPLLDELPGLTNVFATIEFAGKLPLGGVGKSRPSLSALGKQATYRAGFDLVSKKPDEIRSAIADLAVPKNLTSNDALGGLDGLFGWAYHAARYTREISHVFGDCMVEVAAIQVGLPGRISDYIELMKRTQLVDLAIVAKELGLSREAIRKVAATMGMRENCSRYYDAFTAEEVEIVRNAVGKLINRDDAASILDVPRPFFDNLVYHGLIPTFISAKSADRCRFRPQDIVSFAEPIIKRTKLINAQNFTGQPLNRARPPRRSPEANPFRLVQMLIEGKIAVYGRCGETFGSILIPEHVGRKVGRSRRSASEADGIGMLDAASRLGVDSSAIVGLRRLGLLTLSSTNNTLLDRKSFDNFHKAYCPSRHYAPLLKCKPNYTPQRLRNLGIEVIRLDRTKCVANFVNRTQARRVLQIKTDPDVPTDARAKFLTTLINKIGEATTFRLFSRTDGITFRTGKGSLSLFVKLDWKNGCLQIGPRYTPSTSERKRSDVLRRRSDIEATFTHELTWEKDVDSLYVYTLLEDLKFRTPGCWPGICGRVVQVFGEFKRHFEPPQRR